MSGPAAGIISFANLKLMMDKRDVFRIFLFCYRDDEEVRYGINSI